MSPPSVLVVKAVRATEQQQSLTAFDIDNTMLDSEPHIVSLEQRRDSEICQMSGIPLPMFENVRKGDVSSRPEPFDLSLSIPVIAHYAGMHWTVEECMHWSRVYLMKIQHTEQHALGLVFPGVKKALQEIAQLLRNCIAALTDCPLWLACLRLSEARLLRHFNAVLGVQAFVPKVMRSSRYWPVVEMCLEWTQEIIARTATNVRTLLALDQSACKPSSTGLETLLETDNFARADQVVAIMSGDKAKDGLVATGLSSKSKVRRCGFAHVRIAKHQQLGPNDPQPDCIIEHDFSEIVPYMRRELSAT